MSPASASTVTHEDDGAARRGTLAGATAAVLFGLAAAYVDAHNDEPQAAALVLLAGGFVIGAVAARRPWAASTLLGASILVAHLVAHALRIGPPFAQTAANFGLLLPMIPALIGTMAGMAVRSLVQLGQGRL